MPDAIKKLNYEEAFEQLTQIVQQLENDNLPLNDSLALFEQGQKLADHCQQLLEEAELRVNQLSEDGDIQPFEG
jgi:exodeoxyribonuclease VII small subunit